MIIENQDGMWLHNADQLTDILVNYDEKKIMGYDNTKAVDIGEYSTPEATRVAFRALKNAMKNSLPYIEIMSDETAQEYVRAHNEMMGKE